MRQVHAALRAMLKFAVQDGLIPTNPARDVEPEAPRDLEAEIRAGRRKTMLAAAGYDVNAEGAHNGIDPHQVWDLEEARRFLRAAENEWYGAVFAVMLLAGLRRGEACGLRWEYLDLDAKQLRVVETMVTVGGAATRETPKSAAGVRVVPLLPELIAVLRRYRTMQEEARARVTALGRAWPETDHVFTRPDGKPFHPDSLARLFTRLCAQAGVRRIRVHDLRDTCATLLYEGGWPDEEIARVLGHSDVQVTRERYIHIRQTRLQDRAARSAGLFGASGAPDEA